VTVVYDSYHDMLVYTGAGNDPTKESLTRSSSVNSPSIFVVFRGTEMKSIRDWIQDGDIDIGYPFKDQPNVGIHDGFFDAYSALRPQFLSNLQSLIKSQCQESCPIYLTGHSLGAALATVAAVDLSRLGLTITQLFTMGSPRVGNSAFAKYFGSFKISSLRLVNEGDIVPHLPGQAFGYHHIPTESWFHNGVFVPCNDSGEDPKCSDSLEPWNYSTYDHTHYLGVDLSSEASAAENCDGVYDNNGPANTDFVLR